MTDKAAATGAVRPEGGLMSPRIEVARGIALALVAAVTVHLAVVATRVLDWPESSRTGASLAALGLLPLAALLVAWIDRRRAHLRITAAFLGTFVGVFLAYQLAFSVLPAVFDATRTPAPWSIGAGVALAVVLVLMSL